MAIHLKGHEQLKVAMLIIVSKIMKEMIETIILMKKIKERIKTIMVIKTKRRMNIMKNLYKVKCLVSLGVCGEDLIMIMTITKMTTAN